MEELTAQHVVFIVISLITLASSVVVVTGRNLFHAALALMVSFAGVAGFYVLLEAGFLAAAQLLVYIGAISILMIFAIMMTRRLMQTTESPFNSQAVASLVASIFVFVLLVVVTNDLWNSSFVASTAPAISTGAVQDSVTRIGLLLASPDGYVVPFELVSLLLLGALVGSIFVARVGEDE